MVYRKVKEFLDENTSIGKNLFLTNKKILEFDNEDEEQYNEEEIKEEEEKTNDEEILQPPPYDEVTQNVINRANEARNELEDILRKIGDLESNIRLDFLKKIKF